MLELGAGADVFRSIQRVYGLVVLGAIILAVWLPSKGWQKLVALALCGAVYLALRPAPIPSSAIRAENGQRAQALVLFEDRCRTAPDSISSPIVGVAGITIDGVPQGSSGESNSDQNPLRQSYGRHYIRSFLLSNTDSNGATQSGPHSPEGSPVGFQFVEAFDPMDGARYRYTLKPDLTLAMTPIPRFTARYVVSYQVPMNDEDRSHWIANDVIRITDARAGQVIAEVSRYVMDANRGSRAGQRIPWNLAKGCAGMNYGIHSVRMLVLQVLQPQKQDQKR